MLKNLFQKNKVLDFKKLIGQPTGVVGKGTYKGTGNYVTGIDQANLERMTPEEASRAAAVAQAAQTRSKTLVFGTK